jgi:type IV pilus assembly protein PilQ
VNQPLYRDVRETELKLWRTFFSAMFAVFICLISVRAFAQELEQELYEQTAPSEVVPMVRAQQVNTPSNRSTVQEANNATAETASNALAVQNQVDQLLDQGSSEALAKLGNAKTVDFKFVDASLDMIFGVISKESGINFIYPREVGEKKMSLRISDSSWRKIVGAIVSTQNLRASLVSARIIRIDLQNNYKKQEEMREKIATKSDPERFAAYKLRYANSTAVLKSIRELVTQSHGGSDVKNMNVSGDERSNSIIVDSTPMWHRRIRTLIRKLDVPLLQAEIAIRIIEVQRTTGQFLGVNWNNGLNYDAGRSLGFGSLVFPSSVTAPFAVDTGVSQAASSAGFRLGSLNDIFDIDLRIGLEQSRGNLEILQSGKVVVEDGGVAKISAGQTVYVRPVQMISSSGESFSGGGLQKLELEVKLEVGLVDKRGTKGVKISNNGEIRIPVRVSTATPKSSSDSSQIVTETREVLTEIVTKSSKTSVIGGIYNVSRQVVESGVPFFSDLPIIGALFRSKQETQIKTELLVLITPKLLLPQSEDPLAQELMDPQMPDSPARESDKTERGSTESELGRNARFRQDIQDSIKSLAL